MVALNFFTLLGCFSPIQERRHWLIFVGTRVSVAEFDVNDNYVTLHPLVLVTPLNYLPI